MVDYAHTPDALERVLDTARQLTRGRLGVVFGCGGDRDRGKRPIMGEIAARLADRVWVTSDNPRSEDPAAIIEEIAVGVAGRPRPAAARPDRRAAIREAARLGAAPANGGDRRQGSRDYQIVGTDELAFDDRQVARESLTGAARADGRHAPLHRRQELVRGTQGALVGGRPRIPS